MKDGRLYFALLFAVMLAARLCHTGVLWAEEDLPLAAASQMLFGKVLYRDIWFDKPPLLPGFYLLLGAPAGWLLRAAGAVYALGACALAWAFARDAWGRREAWWAAGLMAFSLTFYLHSAVVPLASDLLMLAPHMAAVWLAWKRRPFWSGALAGVAFLISPKGVFVLAACALWQPRAALVLACGFAAPNALAALWMWTQGSLLSYWLEVWKWGRIYAGGTFVRDPLAHGVLRTLNWAGFHAALLVAATAFLARDRKTPERVRWVAWGLISLAAVALGWRFFPRYFFQLLPVVVLMAARGFVLMGRRGWYVAALLLVPLARFGPRYPMVAAGVEWADTAMDRDSRAAAALVRDLARPGDTLFVWGFRPEVYVYAGLPAATRFLDSQPLTGVPADRHLTQTEILAPGLAAANRAELARAAPAFVVDGLGVYNPRLAVTAFVDLEAWLAGYRRVGQTKGSVVYRRAR